MATKIVTKNSSTASAVPTASDLVQGELAVNVADKRLFTEDNAGAIVELGTNPSGNVTFQDNGKAIFGAGSDLQIYHDGTAGASYIDDVGTGRLYIRGSRVTLQKYTGETMIDVVGDGAVTLYHDNNAPKLATTSTGIDVTGTATMDGLTVEDGGTIQLTKNTVSAGDSLGIIEFHDEDGAVTADSGKFQLQAFRGADKDAPDFKLIGSDAGGTLRTRFQIADNGDISFYEDTGTTPKLFWDASAESLGIGTSSPNRDLHISGGASDIAFGITNSASGTSASDGFSITVENPTPDVAIRQRENANMKFLTNNTERMRIDASGNVGIGTSSPTYNLNVVAGAGTQAIFQAGQSGVSNGYTINSNGTSLTHQWYKDGSEAARIDSSGNLLVGKTASNIGVAGIEAKANGTLVATVNGAETLFLNRLSTDGTILDFRKDGTTVGSIGSRSGVVSTIVLNPASGNGAGLSGGTKTIVPADEAGIIDNDISLGISTHRFKDLYLSGGVYLGGTGAANKLDDYEEGTWTPAVSHGGVAATMTDLGASGSYTKVGRMVTLQGNAKVASTNGTGTAVLTGFPFTVGDTVAVTGVEATGAIGYYANWGDNVNSLFLTATSASTTGEIYGNHNASGVNSSATAITQAELNANAEFRFTLTYFTA